MHVLPHEDCRVDIVHVGAEAHTVARFSGHFNSLYGGQQNGLQKLGEKMEEVEGQVNGASHLEIYLYIEFMNSLTLFKGKLRRQGKRKLHGKSSIFSLYAIT
ncbi:hypothetical protein SAY86_014835 [Trapa natans]|uniref:Uncharacterized protein n=1 Tax=Trapa natans TaxID=22666 RepID=A0AAN7KHV9_TRANT|nr:hypothetical protein SAY86_014835 [Trapa natans]